MNSWSYYPSIDMHGEYTTTAYTVVDSFIKDNKKLRNKYVVIVHGKGSGALKKEVHKILKSHPLVKSFQLDGFNLGQTIVEIKLDR